MSSSVRGAVHLTYFSLFVKMTFHFFVMTFFLNNQLLLYFTHICQRLSLGAEGKITSPEQFHEAMARDGNHKTGQSSAVAAAAEG